MKQQRIEELALTAANLKYSLKHEFYTTITQEEIDFLCKELNRQISLYVYGPAR